MKTTVSEIKRSLVFLVCALVAAAFSGCTNDDAVQTPQPTDGDIVQVTAQVASSELAFTRGADGLNDATSKFSLLTTESASSKLNISVDNGSGAYSNFAYSITGASTISAPATPPYFPAGVNTVHVYGWYPENGGSSTFTVQANQQEKADYCLSDVMVAQPAECTRSLVSETWNVTAASLTFNHIMSKIKVVVAPTAGVTITGVRLLGIKPTVALNIPAGASPSITAGTASGTAGTITLLSGGSITSASDADAKVLCGVFPPGQSLSGNFMEIDATVGGLSSTITYQLSSAKTFAGNQQYDITATVGAISTDETVNIGDWAERGNDPLNISVGTLTDPAEMAPAKILQNPLYYVAQYNLATIKGVNDLSGSAAAATTFCTSHNIMGSNTSPALMFQQSDALLTRTGQSGALSGWHLPDVREQIAIVPDTEAHATSTSETPVGGPNIWGFTSTDASNPGTMAEASCKIAGTTVTSSINSVFLCKAIDGGKRYYDHYAVRFINTEYASAWHYVWTGNGLVIESYMLKTIPTTLEEAKKVLAALPTSSAWSSTRNYAPVTEGSPGTSTSLCYRYLPACGFKSTGTGAADSGIGLACYFWSSSVSGSQGFFWDILTYYGYFREYLNRSTYGFSVRLFRD